MIFRAIAKFVRKRVARSMARYVAGSFSTAETFYIANKLGSKYQDDLADCFNKNPSVIKRDEDFLGVSTRVWEMYCSSNGNVYVYLPPSGERRIHTLH